MYFSVKYIDLQSFEKTKDVNLTSFELTDDEKEALHIHNKELIVNPDCYMAIILDYIFEKVGIADNNRAPFDMVNHQGKLMKIQSYSPTFSGLNVFSDKEQYYVVFCDKGENKPLLSKISQEYQDLIEGRTRKVRKKKSRASINKPTKGSSVMLQKITSGRTLKRNTSRAREVTEQRSINFT